ncbi:MAG: hypothetical protein Q4B54_03215 [Coriobacteriales bacterium]|nr:hypothetical protein [Coriobacteriales bacterium]
MRDMRRAEEPRQSGDTVVWIFGLQEDVGALPAGDGIIVAPQGQENAAQYVSLEKIEDGTNSHGKYLWYVVGEGMPIFERFGGKASINYK